MCVRSAQRVNLRKTYVDTLVSSLTRRGRQHLLVTLRREKQGYCSETPHTISGARTREACMTGKPEVVGRGVEEEEESLFNRKYMVWETSIKTNMVAGIEATHVEWMKSTFCNSAH